tara:strand:- start:929 stop:1330 length:402 start_codon:yes stop_codon:yes gene_type:complete
MSFNKGTLATITHGCAHTVTDEWELKRRTRAITVWRRATSVDKDNWHEAKRKRSAEAEARGESTFLIHMDEGGEPRLSPRDVYLDFALGDVVHIVRGRCSAELGYHNVRNCAQVLLPSGELGFIEKKYLAPVQ